MPDMIDFHGAGHTVRNSDAKSEGRLGKDCLFLDTEGGNH
jgi:hypothetical protein